MGTANMAAHAESLHRRAERESQLTPTLTKKMLLLFIVGDILGGGIYARTGEVAGEIGGAIWTGLRARRRDRRVHRRLLRRARRRSIPQAAGAALYIHKAFKRRC